MIEPYYKGRLFHMMVWKEEGKCEAQDFLDELKKGGAPAQQDFETLVTSRIKRMADHGPITNEVQCKLLEDGIFEFKAGNGSRLLWFFVPKVRAVVICTHGFHKPPGNKGYKPEIEHAKDIRDKLMQELAAQQEAQAKTAKSGKAGLSRKKR